MQPPSPSHLQDIRPKQNTTQSFSTQQNIQQHIPQPQIHPQQPQQAGNPKNPPTFLHITSLLPVFYLHLVVMLITTSHCHQVTTVPS